MKKNSRIFSIIKISKIATIFLFVVILVKLTYVAISPKVDGIDLNTFALSRTTATKTIEASRGTIYDINKIKVLQESADINQDKIHIYCAMQLYLDFINIFLRILSLFGKSKD